MFNRTKEQVEEESYLIEELKKIEIRKKERERKQQDVNKLLTAVVEIENSKQNAQLQLQSIKQKYPHDNRPISNVNINQQQQPQLSSSMSAASSSATSLNKRIKQRKFSQSNTSQNATTNSGNNSLNNSTDLNGLVISPSQQANTTVDAKDSKNMKKSLIFKAVVESAGIKFPDNKLAGVTLRSYKVKIFTYFKTLLFNNLTHTEKAATISWN